MAKIGSWGPDLVFVVNSHRQSTFSEGKRTVKARWKAHNLNQRKPRMEYMGIDQPTVSLQVVFSVDRGQSTPRRFEGRLEGACMRGELHYLYIGGKRIGGNKYYIDSITTHWDTIYRDGKFLKVTSDITFKEYN